MVTCVKRMHATFKNLEVIQKAAKVEWWRNVLRDEVSRVLSRTRSDRASYVLLKIEILKFRIFTERVNLIMASFAL